MQIVLLFNVYEYKPETKDQVSMLHFGLLLHKNCMWSILGIYYLSKKYLWMCKGIKKMLQVSKINLQLNFNVHLA